MLWFLADKAGLPTPSYKGKCSVYTVTFLIFWVPVLTQLKWYHHTREEGISKFGQLSVASDQGMPSVVCARKWKTWGEGTEVIYSGRRHVWLNRRTLNPHSSILCQIPLVLLHFTVAKQAKYCDRSNFNFRIQSFKTRNDYRIILMLLSKNIRKCKFIRNIPWDRKSFG